MPSIFFIFSPIFRILLFFPFSLFLKELIQPSVPLNFRFRKIGTFVVIQSGTGSRNRAVYGSLEPEPAEKKPEAGAEKNAAPVTALRR